MNFSPKDVQNSCKQYGPQVAPLVSLDGARLLWALAMNESSGGVNCGPRHEPAFDIGGSLYKASPRQQGLVAQFGKAAASSYGPLQMMFSNSPDGTKPSDFDDLDTAMKLSVGFLNHELDRFKPVLLNTIGQIWNGGSPMKNPGAGVQAYCSNLAKHYNAGLTPVTGN